MEKTFDISKHMKADLLEGLILSGDETVAVLEDDFIVNRKLPEADRVTLVSLGGIGYAGELYSLVGDGMLDVVVVGDVEAAPGPQTCIEALALADRGKGVLFVVPEKHEEQLTAGFVMKQVEKLGLNVAKIDVNCDDWLKFVLQIKFIGAATSEGKNLVELAEFAQKITKNVTVADIEKITEESVVEAIDKITSVLTLKHGDKVVLGVEGNGCIGMSEEFVLFRQCHELIDDKGIEIVASSVGKMATFNEKNGVDIFAIGVDEEMLALWNKSCNTLRRRM